MRFLLRSPEASKGSSGSFKAPRLPCTSAQIPIRKGCSTATLIHCAKQLRGGMGSCLRAALFCSRHTKIAATHVAEVGGIEHQLMGVFTGDDPGQTAMDVEQVRR